MGTVMRQFPFLFFDAPDEISEKSLCIPHNLH